MQMGFRWYGEGNDRISLNDIRQIPGVSTIVWALHDKMPGEIWQPEEIAAVEKQIKGAEKALEKIVEAYAEAE
jgi:mannonate dehydratase